MSDMEWTKRRTWVNYTTGNTITLTDKRAMEALTLGVWDIRPPAGVTWAVRTASILEDAAKLESDAADFRREREKQAAARAKEERALAAAKAREEKAAAAEAKRQAATAKKAAAEAKKAGKVLVSA